MISSIAIEIMACLLLDLGIPTSAIPLYSEALAANPTPASTAVTFRELWDHEEHYRGRWVEVQGTIKREFAGPAAGELPERVESWVASPSGDLTCLVYPSPGAPVSRAGHVGDIRFVGMFLGVIEYESGDVVRRAPLVVGPAAPAQVPALVRESSGDDAWGWIVGVGLLGVFAIAVARISSRRPRRRLTDSLPPVEFES